MQSYILLEYWRTLYPWSRLKRFLLLQDGGCKGEDGEGVWRRAHLGCVFPGYIWRRHFDHKNVNQIKETLIGDGLKVATSLHLHPLPRAFFVIDFDIREMTLKDKSTLEFWPFWQSICNHHPKSICRMCWTLAEVMLVLCKAILTEMGLRRGAAEPLVLFSGGNGLHLYFRLDLDGLEGRALGSAEARALFFELVSTRQALKKNPVCAALLATLWKERVLDDPERAQAFAQAFAEHPKQAEEEEMDCLLPLFDVGASVSSAHMLKVPFSLHDRTGAVALPLVCNPHPPFELVARLLRSPRDFANRLLFEKGKSDEDWNRGLAEWDRWLNGK
jgi:DNA primase catalytic subunit